jgi:predicted NUDIX family NTP pyrophosphohydrolase
MEWPPHSGRQQEFPEVDRAAWFDADTAKVKLLKGQVDFIDRLLKSLTEVSTNPNPASTF